MTLPGAAVPSIWAVHGSYAITSFFSAITYLTSNTIVTTVADIRLLLAQAEAEEAKQGIQSLHEITASAFISQGLDLEAQQ